MIRLAIPLVATLVALFLYLRRPMAYVGFTLWVWLLTPLVRRLVDLQLGWADPNLVLLAPFLVAAVSLLTVLAPGKDTPRRIPPAFVLCGLAILYGFVMGLAQHPSTETVFALFNWLSPVAFGLHLALNSRLYPTLRRTLERHVTAGVLVLGVYGLYQFFVAPAWDTYWLESISTGLIDPSFGQPKPMGIRVWSTLNAPGPFANVMMAGLLLLFVTSSRLRIPASIAGYASFLLSFVRTSWLGWILGFLLLLRGQRPATLVKLVATVALLVAILVPILNHPALAPLVGDRFKTFTHLAQDESFRERTAMYHSILGLVAQDPFGHGLRNQEIVGNVVVDSGVLIVLLQLGWMGAALYAVGILVFLFGQGGGRHARRDARPLDHPPDRFPQAMKAICIAYLAQLLGGMVFVGVTGAIFWICLGMTLSASAWHASLPGLELDAKLEASSNPTLLPA